jgi:hypothetical protein
MLDLIKGNDGKERLMVANDREETERLKRLADLRKLATDIKDEFYELTPINCVRKPSVTVMVNANNPRCDVISDNEERLCVVFPSVCGRCNVPRDIEVHAYGTVVCVAPKISKK